MRGSRAWRPAEEPALLAAVELVALRRGAEGEPPSEDDAARAKLREALETALRLHAAAPEKACANADEVMPRHKLLGELAALKAAETKALLEEAADAALEAGHPKAAAQLALKIDALATVCEK